MDVGSYPAITNENKVLAYLDEKTVGHNKLLKSYRARCLTVRAFGYRMWMERFQKAYLKWGATIALQQTERNNQLNSDFTLYRSSETLLMMAEAQALSGKENEAKQTLNILLKARTKESADQVLTCDNYPSMKGLSVLDMVKLQWRIEMWGENGLEFYNNKRWGVNVDRSGSSVHWSTNKTLSFDRMTLEIPMTETSTNPNWGQ